MGLHLRNMTVRSGLGIWGLRSVRALTAWSAALAYVFLLFRAYPGLDPLASRLFFFETTCHAGSPQALVCGHFAFRDEWLLQWARSILFYAPFAAALYLIWQLVRAYQHHGPTHDAARVRAYSNAVLAFILGPGLLVNGYLKAFSHRPRPFETDLFGGDWLFRIAGDFGGQCISNCSFISGEAASAGWLFCAVLFLPRNNRSRLCRWTAAVCVSGMFLRVAVGGHYLSDVLLGFLSSPVIFWSVFAVSDCVVLARQSAGETQR